ncbi:hypothetical protein FE257_008209 [Aspergillus nanangensis]|uniref:Uncharacterized protein n=1 Tax=Aspergillus nanangensis TaxID=2582783 RepID=A0AAD4CLQ5_ASPNN|nr:hypothetical protein FE257_008209 [Aspergillus nanangensis]
MSIPEHRNAEFDISIVPVTTATSKGLKQGLWEPAERFSAFTIKHVPWNRVTDFFGCLGAFAFVGARRVAS